MISLQGENIILIIVLLILLFIVIKFIKGLIKFVLIVFLILTVGFSTYNLLVVKKPISYEINRYKTEYSYYRDISKISGDVINLVNNIKEGKNTKESIEKLQEERNKVALLNHSDESKFIHDKYIGALDTIIFISRSSESYEETKDKLDKGLEELNIGLSDLIFISKENSSR
ncbi:hypothetical protein, partial [Clostridium sp.]|uniref:hypothetical protein n=1 Tax=Clostridium sp. TaxID=1506 RepID=UPI00346456AA